MKRETLFKYAREHFKSEPEYLWSNLPHLSRPKARRW